MLCLPKGWCQDDRNRESSLWDEACNPASVRFGSRSLTVDAGGQLKEATGSELVDGRVESPYCEVCENVD